MKITEVLALVNDMERDCVIDRYAIGGAVAAAMYLEPIATLDIDIFVAFRIQENQFLISPQPLYDYLVPRQKSGRCFNADFRRRNSPHIL